MLKTKQLVTILMVALTLGLTSCGTSSKKNAEGSDQPGMSDQDTSENMGTENIALNADSDSNKAGPLQTVTFAFNSATLGSSAKSALQNNANFLKANPSLEVQIEGHCDERGGVQYNLALGERRARTTRQYLVSLGVKSSQMNTISFGKERPVAFGHDDTAWNQNRRANFVVTAK